MKNIFVISISIALILSSCKVTRNITEQYIKNNIEVHSIGQQQNSTTYTIFKGYSMDYNSYLEMTGFFQGKDKKLVIGVDKYYKLRPKYTTDQTVLAKIYYLELNETEFLAFYNELLKLQSRRASLVARKNEEVYADYTVKSDFFISARKTYGASPNMFYVNLWINGEKYEVQTKLLISQLEKFKNWNP